MYRNIGEDQNTYLSNFHIRNLLNSSSIANDKSIFRKNADGNTDSVKNTENLSVICCATTQVKK